MITTENINDILSSGGDVIDASGEKIGGVGQIFVDDQTDQPSWVTVKTGLFGMSESFAPLDGATVEGSDIRVTCRKDQVKDAPRIDDKDGRISPEQEDELYRYYGMSSGNLQYDRDAGTTTGNLERDARDLTTDTAGRGTDTFDRDRDTLDTDTFDRDRDTLDTDTLDRDTVGRDTVGRDTDDEVVTRSEEQLHVGTERRETGRARLRKYIVTENVTQTVPVSHEEVRLEREPITDANVDDAMSGPDLTESEHVVTLHEERPVVEKETVPVEQVRLTKDTVTDEVPVDEEVRKEEIELDDRGTDRDRKL